MKLSLTIFLILYSFGLFGQTDSSAIYLAELKKELFKPGNEKIFLYKLIYCLPDDPDWQRIDSTKMVRAAQPDPKIAIELLRKIMFTKNPKLIKELKVIYDRHMTNFMEEWSQVFLDNYYMCESILSQFQVLSGFEQALTSLYHVKSKANAEIVFQNWLRVSFEIFHKNNGSIKDYPNWMNNHFYHSASMHLLNPFHPYDLGVAPFYFFLPWFEEMKPIFVDFILRCNCFNDPITSDSDSCKFVLKNFEYYKKITDPRLKEYLIKQSDHWIKNKEKLLFEYAVQNYDEIFSNNLIDKWIMLPLVKNEKPNYINFTEYWINYLTKRDTRNFPLVLNKLLVLSERDPEKALALSKLLPYDLMNEYSKNYILMLQKMREERKLAPIQYYNKNPNKDGN